ncbi:MAG TPA: hypothetical protein VES01_06665, partial [Dermatophilaceae bacterium]|nr:hypothetical protein [Dermatophilaceae bacterium]
MAGSSYPHLVFASDDAGLTAARLTEVIRGIVGDEATIANPPLSLVVTLEEFSLTLWIDDEADQVAERYVEYLPESARRRRLAVCTTLIDMAGSADPDRRHAATTTRIAAALAELPGVFVFEETTKLFVGMDYGEPAAEPAAPAPEPLPEPEPQPEPEAAPVLQPEP